LGIVTELKLSRFKCKKKVGLWNFEIFIISWQCVFDLSCIFKTWSFSFDCTFDPHGFKVKLSKTKNTTKSSKAVLDFLNFNEFCRVFNLIRNLFQHLWLALRFNYKKIKNPSERLSVQTNFQIFHCCSPA
jgi:hypothetical protein